MLDVDDLQTFVEVADAGGVSSAARRLGVSKSIVSRRLLRLETELGIQLLARTTRGAALTEAGVTFREHAARVCAEIDIARETILPAGDLRGRLRIAEPAGRAKVIDSDLYFPRDNEFSRHRIPPVSPLIPSELSSGYRSLARRGSPAVCQAMSQKVER